MALVPMRDQDQLGTGSEKMVLILCSKLLHQLSPRHSHLSVLFEVLDAHTWEAQNKARACVFPVSHGLPSLPLRVTSLQVLTKYP